MLSRRPSAPRASSAGCGCGDGGSGDDGGAGCDGSRGDGDSDGLSVLEYRANENGICFCSPWTRIHCQPPLDENELSSLLLPLVQLAAEK